MNWRMDGRVHFGDASARLDRWTDLFRTKKFQKCYVEQAKTQRSACAATGRGLTPWLCEQEGACSGTQTEKVYGQRLCAANKTSLLFWRIAVLGQPLSREAQL